MDLQVPQIVFYLCRNGGAFASSLIPGSERGCDVSVVRSLHSRVVSRSLSEASFQGVSLFQHILNLSANIRVKHACRTFSIANYSKATDLIFPRIVIYEADPEWAILLARRVENEAPDVPPLAVDELKTPSMFCLPFITRGVGVVPCHDVDEAVCKGVLRPPSLEEVVFDLP